MSCHGQNGTLWYAQITLTIAEFMHWGNILQYNGVEIQGSVLI
jgi:hypothetical protein